MHAFRKVVVAVDGSDNALRAARTAVRLADSLDVPLVMLHVFPLMTSDLPGALGMSQEDLEDIRDRSARQTFDAVRSEISERDGPIEEVARIGDVAGEIIDYLDNAHDLLLVMGRRGQTQLGSLLLGSVSDKVMRHTKTPVTVVS
ncbi:MAG: universal stress protein [Wenzhouxiangella sp.]|nr:MAG: universal stress protein [Wenzhouxiangella sp.]